MKLSGIIYTLVAQTRCVDVDERSTGREKKEERRQKVEQTREDSIITLRLK